MNKRKKKQKSFFPYVDKPFPIIDTYKMATTDLIFDPNEHKIVPALKEMFDSPFKRMVRSIAKDLRK